MEVLRPPEEDVKPDLSDLPTQNVDEYSRKRDRSRSRDRDRYDKRDRDRHRQRDKRTDHRDRSKRFSRSPEANRRSRSPKSSRRSNYDKDKPYNDRQIEKQKGSDSNHELKLSRDTSDILPDVNIKQEVVSDDSQERSITEKSEDLQIKKRKKRRHTSSSSNMSDFEDNRHKDKSSKHKKTKHKKKHSKKHKHKS